MKLKGIKQMDKTETKCDTPCHLTKKMPKIATPIIVEGRYDKGTIQSIFDCRVIVTDGFGIFNSREKQALIRKVAQRSGVIILTDSDGGGKQIRSFLSGILPPEKIHQLYIPEIPGKESRKASPSAAGLLGVEGVGREILLKVFEKFIQKDGIDSAADKAFEVSTAEFYSLGLTGAENSAALRDKLSEKLGLPTGMGAKAMMRAIPMILSYSEWLSLKEELFS